MAKPGEFERPFEAATAEYFRQRAADIFALSDTTIPERVEVRSTDDPRFDQAYPAVLEWQNHGSEAVIMYSRRAIEDTAQAFGNDPETFGAFERLYVGGGIATGILHRSIDPGDPEQVQGVFDHLIEPTSIVRAIHQSSEFDMRDEVVLGVSLGKADEARLCRLGVLRYAVGVYDHLEQNSTILPPLRQKAVEDIRLALRTLGMYDMLTRAMRVQDADIVVGKISADAISEISLALSFPMDAEELRELIGLAVNSAEDSPLRYTEDVIKEVPDEGFYETD